MKSSVVENVRGSGSDKFYSPEPRPGFVYVNRFPVFFQPNFDIVQAGFPVTLGPPQFGVIYFETKFSPGEPESC